MWTPGSFLNRHVLKKETVEAVEREGRLVSEIVDRWAGGYPKRTKRLEAKGIDKLIEAARRQADMESAAFDVLREFPDLSWVEAVQMCGLDPLAPPPSGDDD